MDQSRHRADDDGNGEEKHSGGHCPREHRIATTPTPESLPGRNRARRYWEILQKVAQVLCESRRHRVALVRFLRERFKANVYKVGRQAPLKPIGTDWLFRMSQKQRFDRRLTVKRRPARKGLV